MVTIRPHQDEYTLVFVNMIQQHVKWTDYFDAYYMVEEDETHIHLAFKLRQEFQAKTRIAFNNTIAQRIQNELKLREMEELKIISVASKVTWPKKNDNWIKLLGYCLKNKVMEPPQPWCQLARVNVSDQDLVLAEEAAKQNTGALGLKYITVREYGAMVYRYHMSDLKISLENWLLDEGMICTGTRMAMTDMEEKMKALALHRRTGIQITPNTLAE